MVFISPTWEEPIEDILLLVQLSENSGNCRNVCDKLSEMEIHLMGIK